MDDLEIGIGYWALGHKRKLVTEEQYTHIMNRLDIPGRMINTYIGSIGDVEEPLVEYLRFDEFVRENENKLPKPGLPMPNAKCPTPRLQ